MAASAVEVRAATRADLPVLFDHCRALAAHHDLADGQHFTATAEQLARALDDGLVRALVATTTATAAAAGDGHDVVVAGSAIYARTFSTWSGRRNVLLEHLFVEPASRGAGLGRALLAHLLERAERGVGRVELSVQASNTASRRAYASLGAREHEGWLEMRLEAAQWEAGRGQRQQRQQQQGTDVGMA